MFGYRAKIVHQPRAPTNVTVIRNGFGACTAEKSAAARKTLIAGDVTRRRLAQDDGLQQPLLSGAAGNQRGKVGGPA
jgi:hypothetical protein